MFQWLEGANAQFSRMDKVKVKSNCKKIKPLTRGIEVSLERSSKRQQWQANPNLEDLMGSAHQMAMAVKNRCLKTLG